MAVFKDSLNRWRWRTRVTNPFTKATARLSGSAPAALNTRKAAETDERAHVEEFRLPPGQKPSEALTLREYVAEFYRPWMTLSRKALATVTARESHLGVHILPKLGDLRLTDITRGVVEKFVTGLLESAQMPRGTATEPTTRRRSVRTVGHIRTTLHSVLVRATKTDHLASVPPFPALPPIEKKAPNFLEYSEEKALYGAARDDDERALFLVAIRCGLRASEQKALRWEDLNFDRRTLNVKRALVKGEYKAPKGRSERTVDLDQETIEALKKIRHLRSELVFCQADGAPFTYDHLEARLLRALKKAGVARHLRYHDLRHTFGSHLAIAGVDIFVICNLMGHQSVNTTSIYAHLIRKNGRDAVAKAAEARAGDGA